jgi:hypothetical protein
LRAFIRTESSDRGDKFIRDKFSLNDQRRKRCQLGNQIATRDIAGAQLDREKRRILHEPQIVIAATRFHATTGEIAKTLISQA